MITIEVFGPGCRRCQATLAAVEQAVSALGDQARVIHISDPLELAKQRIMFTPAVRVDGELKCAGRVPSAAEVASWLPSVLG